MENPSKSMDYDPTTAQRNELIWLYIKENELKNLETHSQTVRQMTPKQTEESPQKNGELFKQRRTADGLGSKTTAPTHNLTKRG